MPWLHLLAEDNGEAVGPGGILANGRPDLSCQVVEDFGGEGAAVVEVELKGVGCARDGRA